jgi:hypothetical protein
LHPQAEVEALSPCQSGVAYGSPVKVEEIRGAHLEISDQGPS